MSLAVFETIGPLELLIVLVIVLVIFGPKRLPGLGRQLGSGMREFKDSIRGKADEDDRRRRRRRLAAAQAAAALGRPEDDDGHAARVGRGRLRAAARRADVGHPAADRARGSAEPRRAPRRAAHAADHLRRRRSSSRSASASGRTTRSSTSSTGRSTERAHAAQELAATKDPLERTAAFQAELRSDLAGVGADVDGLAAAADSPALRARLRAARDAGRARSPKRCRRRRSAGRSRWASASRSPRLRSSPTRRCCSRCRCCSARRTRSSCRRSRPRERQVALPLMVMVPFLFIAGVVFALLHRAAERDQLPAELQRRQLRHPHPGQRRTTGSRSLVLVAMGVAVPGAGRDPRDHPHGDRHRRSSCARTARYAILVIAIVAMLLPGQDPVTMLLADAPALVLYEGSILLARCSTGALARREADEPDDVDPTLDS